jgi:isorenieratene synthase
MHAPVDTLLELNDERKGSSIVDDSRGQSMERSAHVVVLGGGLAGCAAATILAERGLRVTVIEKESYLGGRVGSWSDCLKDGTTFHMERGFHAFFRQYYSVRALLRRVDPTLSCLRPLDDYPLLGPEGWRESFARLPRSVPLNLVSLVWRTPSLRLRDLVRVDVRVALEMLSFDPDETYARWDRTTARTYLDSLRFPERARRMLFDVFAHSFFNPEEDYSAAELLAMFHFYFLGNPEGLVFDVLREPFGVALFEPLRTYLEKRNASFVMSESAHAIRRDGERFIVSCAKSQHACDAIVCAMNVPALRDLVEASPELGDPAWRSSIASLDTTLPFAVLRLWLDRKLDDGRAPFAGTTGLGILDNISIYEKLEEPSAQWAARTGGSIVELHAYAVDRKAPPDEIRRELLEGLYRTYPESRNANIIEERFLVRDDCPSFAPGSHERRPGIQTPVKGLWLAGDFVKLPFPSALMERAVVSGFRAANGIVATLGAHAEPIRTVPQRGLLAGSARKNQESRASW